MTVQSVSLSPAEGLLARQISYWINVSADGRGGSKDQLGRGWTYLSADDLQSRVLDYDTVDLSIPTIYRALRSLVKKGWFIREKLTAHRWFQVFHYTFGPNHPSNFTSNGSDQSDQLEVVKADSSQLSVQPDFSTSKSIKPVAVAPKAIQQPNSIDKEGRRFMPAPQVCIDMYNSGEFAERVGFGPTVSSDQREGFDPSINQPLQSIKDAAPSELLLELQTIEANYQKQLNDLRDAEIASETSQATSNASDAEAVDLTTQKPFDASGSIQELSDPSKLNEATASSPKASSGLERGIHNPQVETNGLVARRAHNPKVGTGDIWERIRALASQFEPTQVETVSPKAVITKKGERLRVDDGVTAPLR